MPDPTVSRDSSASLSRRLGRAIAAEGWLLAVLLLAAGLGFYQLGRESLWTDELLSVRDSGRVLSGRLFADPRPLYHLLLGGWRAIGGEGDVWMRSLGVLCFLGTVFLVDRLGRERVDRATGGLAALLVALSPLMLNHAQEVRMYALSALLGVGGTLFMGRVLDDPTGPRLAGWVGLRFLAIVTTPINLLLMPADGLLALGRFWGRWRSLGRAVGGAIAIGLLWSPWAINAIVATLKFAGEVEATDEPGSPDPAPAQYPTPGVWAVVRQAGRFAVWHFGRANSNAIYGFYLVMGVLLAGLLGAGLVRAWRDRRRSPGLLWIATWAIVPPGAIFLASYGSRVLWVNRYLSFAAPYWLLLVAAGFWAVWRRWRWVAWGLAMAYAVAMAGGLRRYYTVAERDRWRELVAEIATADRPGDPIVWSFGQRVPVALEHYYPGDYRAIVLDPLPPETEDPEAIAAWFDDLPPGDRLWLVHAALSPEAEAALNDRFEALSRESFDVGGDRGKIDVWQLQRR